MDQYFINDDTLILIPLEKNITKIFETNNSFIIKKNIMDIVDESCQYFGSSYRGRYIGSKSLLKMDYKLPIIVEEMKEIIIFPTCSPRQDDCCWINLQNVENYEKHNQHTIVYFKNKVSSDLDISYGSFENQIFRSTMLLMTLKRRKK